MLRRLPLTSTSVSFADKPRSDAERTMFARSPPLACVWNVGSSFSNASIMLAWPVFCNSAAPITEIGDTLSVALVPTDRVPVTIT